MTASEIITWVVSITVSAVITTTVGILLKRAADKFYKTQEEKNEQFKIDLKELEDRRREQHKKELDEIVRNHIEPIQKDLELIKTGNQAALRHNLYEIYDYYNARGYCPLEVKTDFENLYASYHSLGKNGVMDGCHKKLMELPDVVKEPQKQVRKAKAVTAKKEQE